jgi:hypothetical protein
MALQFVFEYDGKDLPETGGSRIFVDATNKRSFKDADLELSHWNPNNTNDLYRADTSTEIAFNYLSLESIPTEGLVINDHLDIDGILSVFVFLNPELARKHRETLIEIAEMGDFWAYGNLVSRRIYQALVVYCQEKMAQGLDHETIYNECLELIPNLLGKDLGDSISADIESHLNLVNDGKIARAIYHYRFVSFVIPKNLHNGDLEHALNIPSFNTPLGHDSILSGVARNEKDAERIQLISVEADNGWYHDMLYPGYMWAEFINRWRAPGFWESEDSNTWYFKYSPLNEAVSQLKKLEKNPGNWQIAEELTPFSCGLGRGFPVVLSFINNDDLPAKSSISPEVASDILQRAYTFDKASRR